MSGTLARYIMYEKMGIRTCTGLDKSQIISNNKNTQSTNTNIINVNIQHSSNNSYFTESYCNQNFEREYGNSYVRYAEH